MRYTLKQGYIRKLKLFVREKIKILDEAEINLKTVDRSGNLLPRKVNKNAHIVKRHRAIYEGNARKKVIQKSQIKNSSNGPEPEDELLVPFKKVSFLPAYFFKVFIKKKKPEAEKPGGKFAKKPDPKDPKNAKGGKVDPKKAAEEEKQGDAKDVINLKTKKLMS